MKRYKKIIILISIVILVLGTIFILDKLHISNEKKPEDKKYDSNVINEIKSRINATADTGIYQIVEEYDGKQMIQIRPEVQYKSVFAGIVKKGKPEIVEIDTLTQNTPSKKGIWISEDSRNRFLEILRSNDIDDYNINDEGYLECEEISKRVDDNKLYIIDISGTCYVRDELSGEIVEYPFERMDPYQVLERFVAKISNQVNVILEVTTNENEMLSNKEILDTILINMENVE